ncbi:hypothetical protein [Caldibacillus thermoamylovorans]|uniref:hypothetical protein n=1 Tax=Caldibacillus thermoamylovorans TaxID=35841 RepID=UPI002040FE7C|nr:hypothetical protein [Caldibacillus thermoamylovorans]MCM3053659.1 hypothetical protein [Caldibacillus thermoamylovorans]
MSKNKIRKPVCFNVTNEKDVQILEHLKGKNFSGYVKELIERDMNRRIVHSNGGGLKIIVE